MILYRYRNKRGVTLIELIITLAIVSIVMGMVFGFFFQGTKIYSMADKKSSAYQDSSIASFRITNSIKNIKEISLVSKAGFTQLNIQNEYPNINNIEYNIIEESVGIYSLEYKIVHNEGYVIESKIYLNNVKKADIGSGSDIWYSNSYIDIVSPTIALGSSSGILIEGVSGTMSYSVSTANIANGGILNVSLDSSPTGLSITSNPQVNSNTAIITITGTVAIKSDVYTFTVNFPGAIECLGVFVVSDNIPAPSLEEFLDTYKFVVMDPTSTAPKISITPPSNMGGEMVTIVGSVGIYSARITVEGLTATVTRPTQEFQALTITLTAIRASETKTRVVYVIVPKKNVGNVEIIK